MKYLIPIALMIALAVAAGAKTLSKTDTARPPYISADSWIPISDTSGVAISKIDRYPDLSEITDSDERKRLEAEIPLTAEGKLMAKVNGRWITVRWSPPSGEVVPLDESRF